MICPCGCPNTIKIPSPRKMFKRSDPLMPISIYLATWNVLSRPPEEDLKPLLGLEDVANPNSLPDIYAIGLQEVKAMPYSILMDSIFETSWVKAIRMTLGQFNYVKIRVIRLQGMLLAIFVKKLHLVHIQEIETEYTRTGIGRVWGNKGGVSVRLNAFNCSICIVNCHLAAHDTELKRRIEDYNSIVDSQLFKFPQTENIFFHDYVFWMGDLNFRLDTKPLEEIVSRVEKKDYEILLQDDQLNHVRQSGEAFSELEEAPIKFAPTYKFMPGTHEYDVNRRPAWTDRILYKVHANVYEDVVLDAHSVSYKAHESYTQSDHKPVSSLFNIKVFQTLPDRYVQFGSIKHWTIGKESQVTFFLRAGVQTTIWDWIGLYKADFNNIDDYISYTWVSGHGLAQSVPPVSSAHASEHYINSWEPTDLPLVDGSEEDLNQLGSPPWMISEPASGAGSSYVGSIGAPPTTEGSVSELPSPAWETSAILSEARKKDGERHSKKHTHHRARDHRQSRSHSPMRRISEHISTAVFRLASLFQTVPKSKYVVTFPELVAPVPGQYCLLYLSHGVDNIHGMSDPFEIRMPAELL